MRRPLLVVTVVALVSIGGCAGFGREPAEPSTDGDTDGNETVQSDDPVANATDTNQTVRVAVNDSVAGETWQSLSVSYPRENVTVDGAQHEEIELGVDTNASGTVDRELDASHISGVNNNDYSFTVELDTSYTLETGDHLHVRYPAVDNPSEPGEYGVSVTVNEAQTANATITVAADDAV